jgi:hypothetical protein
MKNNILGLFALVMLMLASCEKATEKEKICALKDCYLCEKKWDDKGDKEAYIWDELGNKIPTSSIAEDSRGKYFSDENGQQFYFESDNTGNYYTDASGNNVYLKDKGWTDKSVEKFVIEPLEYEDDCGYIIKGKIKFLVDGKTAAIVDYGDGTIDEWAVKTIYIHKQGHKGKEKGKGKKGGDKDCDKDWDKEFTKCCKFKQKCKLEVEAASNSKETTINH